ncbi:MAG: permease-like cell division protein FtsX [Micropruina glycogenica]|jgi:cell division transport system permease protein|uniref:Cell division protein FtsX n=1 Tax=Micropruina glycogenica TaxID=75385 RepID=A0A2N9JFW5_9ACTN|nr:permease-like cell division protein FtsX [Micropruina glycogenica]MCB0891409.1 permease-like cell division protein FtsX [Propionibacteriaceae bacterium]SPD86314.1 Cell division protein FtsX [Micropruina glycogenica]
MRHTLREAWSGLRRNLSMTLAVIVTMWVSLTLFGGGLLGAQQVELLKGRWYDKIEISVFLCVADSKGGNCDPGQGATDAQKNAIRTTLETNPEVATVYYESKAEVWVDFQRVFKDSPVLADMTQDMMQDNFRIKLKNPEQYQGVVSAVSGLPGVQAVSDLRQYLDPLFDWLNIAKWTTIGLSVLLLLAAALQIGTTIRMAAFSRRRELGIMRLVGASNWYIMVPFLLESLVAALAGALLACGSLAALQKFLIIDKAQPSRESVEWIGWSHVGLAMLGVIAVAVVLSVIPTLIATRKYLRV